MFSDRAKNQQTNLIMKISEDEKTLKEQLDKTRLRVEELEKKLEKSEGDLTRQTELYGQTVEELGLAKLITEIMHFLH